MESESAAPESAECKESTSRRLRKMIQFFRRNSCSCLELSNRLEREADNWVRPRGKRSSGVVYAGKCSSKIPGGVSKVFSLIHNRTNLKSTLLSNINRTSSRFQTCFTTGMLAGREVKLAGGVENLVDDELLLFVSRRGWFDSDISLEQNQFFFGLNGLLIGNNELIPNNCSTTLVTQCK